MTFGVHPDVTTTVFASFEKEHDADVMLDRLNKYSLFRERFMEDLLEYEYNLVVKDKKKNRDDLKKFNKTRKKLLEDYKKSKYLVPVDLLDADSLLKENFLIFPLEDWPEDVAFETKTIKVYSLE